jgi:hypothetical protein
MDGMDRRDFIAGAGATAAFLAPSGARSAVQVLAQGAINVVERFGFVGDGRADNYEAFHRLANFANQQGGGNFHFPPGTYFVARYRSIDFKIRDPRETIEPHFLLCDGLSFSGKGAKIRMNGRFHRSSRVGRDGVAVGLHAAILSPFEIRRCRNVRLTGFEIDGGVLETTRDKDVTETYSVLVGLNGCRDVVLEDLNLHHCQSDAIMLSDDVITAGMKGRGTVCRNITLNRVHCSNNARGALAALQVLGLRCTNSSFNGSGFGTGRYGRHAPGFGVDVEPDRHELKDVDSLTGDLEFTSCEFNDNYSAFMAAYSRKYRGYLRLIDCRSSNRNNAPNHMIISWPGALVQGGVHDTGEGTFWTGWDEGGDLTLRGCEIRSSGEYGLFHAFKNNIVHLDRVKVTGTHRRADKAGSFPAIEADPGGGRKNSVKGCEIFLPAARKSRDAAYDLEPSFNHSVCENNLFRTDLPAAGGQHFATRYSADTVVRGDRYRGTAPGRADSFRPKHFSNHDTRLPYSKGAGA